MSVIPSDKSVRRIRRLLSVYGLPGAARVVFHRLLTKQLIPIASVTAPRRLAQLLSGPDGRRTVLVRSTLDMAYPYKQRVHHLALELARADWRVVFITPSTGHDAVLVASSGPQGVIVTPHGGAAIEAAVRPLYFALSTDATLTQADVDRVLSRGGSVIYDYIDRMDDAVSSHPIPAARWQLHERLLADEDNVLVLATADALLREVATRRRRNMLLVTNGVDVDRFKNVAREAIGLRTDFARIVARGRPILGYYGSFASWFDYSLVLRLAEARPGYDVVLVGPDLDGTSVALVDSPANLFVLPAMRYEELPRHAAWFDVCLVPFVVNDITLATSPLKVFEYMALGRPTVSTDLPECRKYRAVLTAEPVGFADACDRALALKDDPSFRAAARQECEASSWARKVQRILNSHHILTADRQCGI